MSDHASTAGRSIEGRAISRDHGPERFLAVAIDGTVVWESPEGWAQGARLANFVHPNDRASLEEALTRAAADPASRHRAACRVVSATGDWRPAAVTVVTGPPEASGMGSLLVTVHETDTHADPAPDLVRRATEDSLTELDNRDTLLSRLRAVEGAYDDASLAVLYLDVDHFKNVNDRMGHAVGDKVLRMVAERLTTAMRPGDTVARIGGDEFVVVAAHVSREEIAVEIAERIRASMAVPIRVGGQYVTATVSVGAAVGPTRKAMSLLHQADVALYRAKGLGRNRAELHRTEGAGRRSGLATPDEVLGEALDRDGLVVVFQPIVELASQQMVAVEAFLRLHDDAGPLRTPDALLLLAEETGLIVSLVAGMLDHASGQVAKWSSSLRGGNSEPLALVWPMSARHLEQPRAADQALAILAAHDLSPDRLSVEITERSLVEPGPNARRNLDQLAQRGVRLVIQDFGAGPASLAFLRHFSPDALKLDAAFMVDFGRDPRHTSLVTGIVALSRAIGITLVAQGVERSEQVDLLQEIGCDQAQGPFFGDPASAEKLVASAAFR